MTLWFDVLVLEKETNSDPEYLVAALKLYYNKQYIPKNSKTKFKPIKKSLHGTSFLLNPEAFFEDKTTDIVYRAQYIRLAGRRDYSQYKHYNIKSLDLSYFSDINLDNIISNPLLTVTKHEIKFKYEEI